MDAADAIRCRQEADMNPFLLLLSLAAAQPDPALLAGLEYRQLQLARGGRSTAVTGVAADPFTFYFGGIGGGVWKSTNAGTTWRNVSDRYFEAGSVGAIAVSESNPLVVYAGTGTACPRVNVSPGVGVYRSDDGGATWVHAGLRDAGQIGRIRIHPRNPDLVYAAVLGHASAPNATRGVFRSSDGGRSWQKVLFVSEKTGIADLALDPADPRVLYAASWSFERKPWAFENGGTEGGIFKSEDGGDTWTRLAGGLPSGVLGRTAVTLSPARPSRVWALIEAAGGAGGLFRSEDAGRTWSRVNGGSMLTFHASYHTHLTPDPVSPDGIYVLSITLMKSTDGGATFAAAPDSHVDHHDLWINPRDPRIMINGNDGGATVSLDGGATWSSQMNQPTGEMYRVAVDTGTPYRVYSAQQDAGAVSVPTASLNMPLNLVDVYDVGGGEASNIAVDPLNPSIVYATVGGQIAKTDTARKTSELLQVYPEARVGQRAAAMEYRTNWNMPLRLSPHDPDVLYIGSQHVHRSRDGGRSWEVISGDLTRNDKAKQQPAHSRGLKRAIAGSEIYDTILVIEESPLVKGLLWVGTDDGLVHVSRDGGKTWTNVTPPAMPEWGTVSTIDPSVHAPGRAVVAVYRYLLGDRRPYIFVTDDYGRSWRGAVDGIDSGHYVRAVREDHDVQGLLYAGTEFGIYVSWDDGGRWQRLQLNLPVAPVSDLLVHRKDLVVSTFGRGLWVLEDLGVVQQAGGLRAETNHLFAPRPGYRPAGNGSYIPVDGGATISYYLTSQTHPVTIEISDEHGAFVVRYVSRAPDDPWPSDLLADFASVFEGRDVVPTRQGINRFRWTGRHAVPFELPGGNDPTWGPLGPFVKPGSYTVKVTAGAWSASQPLTMLADPRIDLATADFDGQLALARDVGARIDGLMKALVRLDALREEVRKRPGTEALVADLDAVEGELSWVRRDGDPGLTPQLTSLYDAIVAGSLAPSSGIRERMRDLLPRLDAALARFEALAKTAQLGQRTLR
jgi:photosystem II stability/assembly factor-like uncharacterized protein